MEENSFGWEYFEKLYKNTIQKGETFSKEMGEEIGNEMKKMYEQYKEWLEKQSK